MTARDRLAAVLAPDVLAALDEYVEDRIAAALTAAPAAIDEPAWLTLEQAAEQLGCSRDAIRMRANRGRLETGRQGRRLYVSAASVRALA